MNICMDSDYSTNSKINSENKLKTCMCSTCCKFLGQRVCIGKNIQGTLRFLGCTCFADGIWCGIELDEQIEKLNEKINNAHYFTCKNDFDVFVLASETYVVYNPMEDNSLKSIMELISLIKSESCYMYLEFQKYCHNVYSNDVLSENLPAKSNLNESYTILNSGKKLSVITEESSLYDISSNSDLVHISKLSNASCLNNCVENGILVDQVVTDSFSAISDEVNKLLKQDFGETSQTSSDSDESLGIIPELIDLNACDNLTFDSCLPSKDLNATINISNNSVQELFGHTFLPEPDLDDVFVCSNLPNVSILCSINNESPSQNNKSMIIYASTPKHEVNFAEITEDVTALALEHNTSPNLHLNKYTDEDEEIGAAFKDEINKPFISETDLILNHKICNKQSSYSLYTNEDLISEQNALNETFEILENNRTSLPHNKDCSSLKNFKKETAYIEEHNELMENFQSSGDQPLIKYESNQYPVYDVIENCQGTNMKIDFTSSGVSKLINIEKQDKSILNITCNLESLDDKLSYSSDFKFLKNVEEENFLNVTLLYPAGCKNNSSEYCINDENRNLQNKTVEILNTTYEKTDASPDLNLSRKSLPCKQSKIGLKRNLKQNKENNAPLLGKTNLSLLKEDTEKNYVTFAQSKNLRKSVGCFGSVKTISKEKSNKERRRNSFGNPGCIIKDSSRTSSTSEDLNNQLKASIKNPVVISKNSNRNSASLLSLKSKTSVKVGNMKISPRQDIKISQKCLLNETISLASLSPELGKTVVKKPRNSMLFSNPIKNTSDQPKTILCENWSKSLGNRTAVPNQNKRASFKLPVCVKNEHAEKIKVDSTASANKTLIKRVSLNKASSVLDNKESKQTRFSSKQFSSDKTKTANSSSEKKISSGQPASSVPAFKSPSCKSSSQFPRAAHIPKVPLNPEAKFVKVPLNGTVILSQENINQQNEKVSNEEQSKKKLRNPGQLSRIPSMKVKSTGGTPHVQKCQEQSSQRVTVKKSTSVVRKIRSPSKTIFK